MKIFHWVNDFDFCLGKVLILDGIGTFCIFQAKKVYIWVALFAAIEKIFSLR